MAEVRVKIGADVRELQKGVQTASRELEGLASDAKRAAGGLSGTGKGLDDLKAGARAAIEESRALRRSMGDVADGAQEAATGATRLGTILQGGLFLGAVAASADFLGTKLVEAFTKGQRAAEEAQRVFAKALPGAVQFGGQADPLQARSREEILAVFRTAEAEVRRLDSLIEESQGGILRQGLAFVQSYLDPAAKTQQQVVNALKEQRGEQQAIADAAGAAFEQYEAQQAIARTLAGLGLDTKSAIEGQADALKEVRRQEEEILALRAKAFAAVQVPAPIGSGQAAPSNPFDFGALPGVPEKEFDESAIEDFLEQQARINAQLAQGSDLFTEFGVSGAAALADVAVGFERLEDLGRIVSGIVRGLVRDLAVAAAKAALINLIFPGAGAAAGGFKGLLRTNLGLPFGGPSASLASAPASVAPLAGLSVQAQRVQVEPFTTTIRGGDLVLGFQQARQQTARTLGNIPLK